MGLISEAVLLLQEYEVKFQKVTPISIRAREFIVINDEHGLILSFHVACKPEMSAFVTLILSQRKFFNLRITDSYYVNAEGIKFLGNPAHNEYQKDLQTEITKRVAEFIEREKVRDRMMADDRFGIVT